MTTETPKSMPCRAPNAPDGKPLRKLREDAEIMFDCAASFTPMGADRKGSTLMATATGHKPLITLAMIARDDFKGLTRAIISALPHVDRVVIGVDARSDTATHVVAQMWADAVVKFHAADLGMSQQDWQADKIDFAAARNFVLEQVTTDWVLTIDTDEHITEAPGDLRATLTAQPATVDAVPCTLVDEGNYLLNSQRIARSSCRWQRPTHNKLDIEQRAKQSAGLVVTQDRSLRTPEAAARRDAQRSAAILDLMDAANNDDLWAMFHVLKELINGRQMSSATRMLKRYIALTDPHSQEAEGRSYLCTAMAVTCYELQRHEDAEYWATTALRDGPRIEVFGLLGTIAEEQGRLYHALGWYQAEAACPNVWHHRWPQVIASRHERRDALLRKMTSAALKQAKSPERSQ